MTEEELKIFSEELSSALNDSICLSLNKPTTEQIIDEIRKEVNKPTNVGYMYFNSAK